MSHLTVTEKEHWKERISRRIDKAIEGVYAEQPALRSRIAEAAQSEALKSLGLLELQRQLDKLAEAEKRGQAAASRWKVPADATLQALRAVSSADILAAEANLFADGIATAFPNLGVTVDGYVFPRKPAQVFATGSQHRVPMLLGTNGREQVPGSVLAKDLPQAIASTYGPLAPRAVTLYVGGRLMRRIGPTWFPRKASRST